MRTLLLSLCLLFPADGFTQTPAPKPPAPATAAPQPPAPAQPAPRRASPRVRAARTGMALTVTDPRGATLPGIRVELLGNADRVGDTDESGQLRLLNLQPGTYRARFSGRDVITFEREIRVTAGQTADIDVTLNPAPAAPQADTPPAAQPGAPAGVATAVPAAGPAGQFLTASILDLLEKEFVGRQPRRESLLSCSGNTRTTMVQLNEPQPERLYDSADSVYYVLGGEGSVRVAGRDTALATNQFMSVPRGTAHGFTRAGRRPLILLHVLSGAPCEAPK